MSLCTHQVHKMDWVLLSLLLLLVVDAGFSGSSAFHALAIEFTDDAQLSFSCQYAHNLSWCQNECTIYS